MTAPTSPLGAVISVNFPNTRPRGVEQARRRPAVVVGVPEFVAPQKYPGLIVVPFTSKLQKYVGFSPALYPVFQAGQGGLTKESIALCSQVRFVGVQRMGTVIGQFNTTELAIIQTALKGMLDI